MTKARTLAPIFTRLRMITVPFDTENLSYAITIFEKADVERYINNLSKAIQIPTISNFNDDLVDWSKFDEFHAFLESAYPLIHSKLEKTIISKNDNAKAKWLPNIKKLLL